MHPLLFAMILLAGLGVVLLAVVLWRGWLRLATSPDTARFRFLLMRPAAPADAATPEAAREDCPAGGGAAAPGPPPGAGADPTGSGREGGCGAVRPELSEPEGVRR
jgi:hypothetical protein